MTKRSAPRAGRLTVAQLREQNQRLTEGLESILKLGIELNERWVVGRAADALGLPDCTFDDEQWAAARFASLLARFVQFLAWDPAEMAAAKAIDLGFLEMRWRLTSEAWQRRCAEVLR